MGHCRSLQPSTTNRHRQKLQEEPSSTNGKKNGLTMKTLLAISVLLQPNTQKTVSSPPSMVSAELNRDLICTQPPLLHGRGGSTPIPLQDGFGRAESGSWSSISCLAKAGGAPIPPASGIKHVEQGAELTAPLRGNKTVGVGAPSALGSCQWSKGSAELPPHLFATRQHESVLHFCRGGVGRA